MNCRIVWNRCCGGLVPRFLLFLWCFGTVGYYRYFFSMGLGILLLWYILVLTTVFDMFCPQYI
ncbi:hypothetical protein GQ44DRAFT_715640 [Phaeosphaeriaceae sp. PMI808]|nr:hypothetical protein GQ44DRAFT_715640 [Phaeosphaeriaceae sp. PMI808]